MRWIMGWGGGKHKEKQSWVWRELMCVSGACVGDCLSRRVSLALFKFHQQHSRQKFQKIQRQEDVECHSVFTSHSVFLECIGAREEWQEIRPDVRAGDWKWGFRMPCLQSALTEKPVGSYRRVPGAREENSPGQGSADWESARGSSCFRCLIRLRAQRGWVTAKILQLWESTLSELLYPETGGHQGVMEVEIPQQHELRATGSTPSRAPAWGVRSRSMLFFIFKIFNSRPWQNTHTPLG